MIVSFLENISPTSEHLGEVVYFGSLARLEKEADPTRPIAWTETEERSLAWLSD